MTNFDKVISSLRYLQLHLDPRSDYNSRYLIQKITYLNQALGMDTNYHFTVYVAGPYSPTLSVDYYSQMPRLRTLESGYQLSSLDKERLDRIKNCCGLLENSSIMESTSTLVFLHRSGNTNDNELIREIRRLKPHLTYETIIIGLTRMKELLFKSEYLTESLKREGDEWDSIDE